MSRDDHATQIQGCIDRLRSGDGSAREELLAHASDRLARPTRKTPRDFAGVSPSDATDDPGHLSAWIGFRREAEAPPGGGRAASNPLFDQGIPQAAAAPVPGLSGRTIGRRWRSARPRPVQTLGGRMPRP